METITESELQNWKNRLAMDNGKAVADFAQMIWSGKVSQQQQIELLKSEDTTIRGAVAWAVADFGCDTAAMRYLIDNCRHDENPRVRVYALLGVEEADFLSLSEKNAIVADFKDEEDRHVLAAIESIKKLTG